MKKQLIIFLFLWQAAGFTQSVFINEIHYDNDGVDVNEGFEIAGPAGTDLSCYEIYLYNGSNNLIYQTISLSGTIDDEGCGYGAVWFAQSGIQNGSPDGICLYNTCTATVEQFLSYEGTITAGDGPANGMTSTDIGVSETGSTIIGESLQLTGNGQSYGDFSWTGPITSTEGTINTAQDFCVGCAGPVAEPTANPNNNAESNIGCTSAQISWNLPADATDVIVAISTGAITDAPADGTAYIANSTFASGDELVVSDGQFVVYNGSGTSVLVSGLSQGTTYNYAIFGYNGVQANCEENYLTGGVFDSFSTLATCNTPQISSIMYNSCNGTAEGTDELIIFEMGDDAIPIDSLTIELPNSTWCNDTCGSNILVNNQTYIDDLNSMAGCALFVYADPIPAGATVVVFTGNPPSTVLDYSSQCGASGAPYYCVFLDNASTTGNFANSTTSPRDLTIHFGSSSSDMVSYIADDGVGNVDGATVNFDAAGNPTYIQSNGCVYPLFVSLIKFGGFAIENDNIIKWTTSSEENTGHFEIQRSEDGVNFETIGSQRATGGSSITRNYEFVDHSPATGSLYYRLLMFDNEMNRTTSQTIEIVRDNTSIYFYNHQIWIGFNDLPNASFQLNIYNVNGQLVHSDQINNDLVIPWAKRGVYIVEIPELNIRRKVICAF